MNYLERTLWKTLERTRENLEKTAEKLREDRWKTQRLSEDPREDLEKT